jgi:DNA repair exonuclease SbcCD nuclease subunit
VKAVISSDWHVDHTTHGVRRFVDVAKAVRRTIDFALDNRVDLYVFGGDLCDPDAGSVVFRCVELAIETALRLADQGIISVWIAGNHDVIEDGSGDTTLSPLRALSFTSPHVFVCESPCVLNFDRSKFRASVMALPFTPTTRGYDVEKTIFELGPQLNFTPALSISHLNVPGVIPGEETTEMPRGREVMLPVPTLNKWVRWMVNGHYHRQQRTDDGVWIPGSLARLTFGEESHEPSFLFLEGESF